MSTDTTPAQSLDHIPLDHIPADRALVQALYAHGKITRHTRDEAMALLYPQQSWGLWASRLLLGIGTTLILTGIVFFFAYNWADMAPMLKFTIVQFGLGACILGAVYCTVERLSGQILLLAGSVLVGVFLAVFGQVYQTGADSYQLFLMWAMLTLGWTVLSNFAPQWLFWLVISNLALVLWWVLAALPSHEMQGMIYIYATLLNGTALVLREYGVHKYGLDWLSQTWTRQVLVIAVLVPLFAPIALFFDSPDETARTQSQSALVSIIVYGVFYNVYRYRIPDMGALSTTVLGICLILEIFLIANLARVVGDGVIILTMGIMTVGIFALALAHLRAVIRQHRQQQQQQQDLTL